MTGINKIRKSDWYKQSLLRSFQAEAPIREVRPPSWDLNIVSFFLRSSSFQPWTTFSLRDLTRRTLFLLLLATAKRGGEIQALSRRVSFSSSAAGLSYVPELVAKTESALRPLPRSFEVPSLGDLAAGMPEDLLRCPVRAFSEYLDRTSGVVNRPHRLFVSSKCPPGPCLRTTFLICYVHSLFNRVLAHGVDRFLERLALEALLHRLPFSVTGLFGALWRWRRDVRTRFLHLFICGVYPLLQMEFTLWVQLLLLVNALGNSHLFLTCSGGGGGVILVCFPQQLA